MLNSAQPCQNDFKLQGSFDLKWTHKSTSSILLAPHPNVNKLAKLEMRKVAASPATDILVLFLNNPGKGEKVPTEFHLMYILCPQASIMR